MEETSGQISKIVVNFNAFDRWTVDKESKNIKHQAQQFRKRRREEHVRGKWNSNDSDTIPQELYVEQWREDHPPVFATKNGGIGGVLFIVNVAGGGKVGSDGKKGRICRIMVNVASKKWKKTKMGHKADEPNNKKMDKWRRNGGDKIDSVTVERDCNCHQLKVFEKKISVGQRK